MTGPQRIVAKMVMPDGTYYWADTRYFPVVSVRLFVKTTVPLATTFGNWLFDLCDQAAAAGQKVIVINDFSRSKIPGSDAREIMAADANRLNENPGFGYWVPVVPNPLLRGVLTAVLWMVESQDEYKRTHHTNGLPEAVAKVRELYSAIGHPLPDITPESYEFPDPSQELRASA